MIIVQLKGGLGNQMFQYAFARYLSIKNNANLLIDKTFLEDRTPKENFVFRNFDLNIFNLDFHFATNEDIALFNKKKPFLSIFKQKHTIINEDKFEYNPNYKNVKGNIFLNGYWQSEKYFNEISNALKKDFQLSITLSEEEDEVLNQIKRHESVCIHFRRTDFINQSGIKVHGMPSMEYYSKSLEMLSEKFSNLELFIFSDDIDWCIDNFTPNFKVNYIKIKNKSHEFASEFKLMINCKHFIIPNSTFSWWAAWLSENQNKQIFVPNKWFEDKELQSQTTFMHPDNWCKVNV